MAGRDRVRSPWRPAEPRSYVRAGRRYRINPSLTSAPLFVGAARAQAVEERGDDDEAADERSLPESADAEQRQAVADDLDERGADDGSERGACASGEIGAADHRGGDHGQLHSLAEPG